MNPPIGVHDADTLTRVPGTLASRLADADEDRFVGRRSELAFFDRLLDGEGDVAVVLVHGRAGIGKSTLLREVVRRGRKGGWEPRIVEGRDLAPVPGELERALENLQHAERPLRCVGVYRAPKVPFTRSGGSAVTRPGHPPSSLLFEALRRHGLVVHHQRRAGQVVEHVARDAAEHQRGRRAEPA
jgi:hypothetical protein